MGLLMASPSGRDRNNHTLGFARGTTLGFARGTTLGFARGETLGFARGATLGFARGAIVIATHRLRSGCNRGSYPSAPLGVQSWQLPIGFARGAIVIAYRKMMSVMREKPI
jgi:hypothetical protein